MQRQTDSLTYAHFAALGHLFTPAQLPRWQQLAPILPRRLQQPGQGPGPDEQRSGQRGGPGGPPPEGAPFGPPK
ncbi:hypothetical protein [Hymenobacter siberiensis]|uniref:hypothetical protein n=1 Tax=Hymenobacter siberiensis TaxID=2848396 RepID=UPI001C1E113E|nr:hypothetical protein [Hymenobacter siberiensis]